MTDKKQAPTSNERPAPCRTEGTFVKPCNTLRSAIDHDRVSLHTLASMTTFKHTRSMVVLKSGEHRKSGIVMAYCPFCGTDISKHLDDAVVDGDRLRLREVSS